MTNLENFKDVRTIMSVSALVAVGVSSSYLYAENSNRKEEITKLEKHLAAIIPSVNPDISKTLNKLLETVHILDTKISKAQEDIKILQNALSNDGNQSAKRVYERITKKGTGSLIDEAIINTKHRATIHTTIPQIREDELDINDDVAAMMG